MDDQALTNEKKITVVIPTYDRPDCISYLIENRFRKYNGGMICFEIHDSSPNDSTKKIFEDANLGDNFQYFHYDSEVNGDIKTMGAISRVKTPYIYLLGDGIAVDFNALEKYLLDIGFEQYSIIGMRDKDLPRYNGSYAEEENITNDISKYFYDCFWMLTLYGASIIRRDVAQSAVSVMQKYMAVTPFIYISCVFDALLNVGGPCYFAYVDFIAYNPYKKSSGWMASHQTIETFCYLYYLAMQLLPECFHATDAAVLQKHNDLSGLFRFRNILRLRSNGNLTWKLYNKYRFYVKKTVPHMSYVYFALFIPPFVIRGALRIHNFFKGKRKKA